MSEPSEDRIKKATESIDKKKMKLEAAMNVMIGAFQETTGDEMASVVKKEDGEYMFHVRRIKPCTGCGHAHINLTPEHYAEDAFENFKAMSVEMMKRGILAREQLTNEMFMILVKSYLTAYAMCLHAQGWDSNRVVAFQQMFEERLQVDMDQVAKEMGIEIKVEKNHE